MNKIEIKRNIIGEEVVADVSVLDKGIHVLLVGGERSHVGAFSVSYEKNDCETIVLPEHKEAFLTIKWSKELNNFFNCPVSVASGIHYDNASKEMIEEIVAETDIMLKEVIEMLERFFK